MRPQQIFENISSAIENSFSVRNVFWFGSAVAGVALTLLHYFKVLPLSFEYFFFYSFLLLLACLARPNWMFLLFVALLPLEIVSIAPLELGIDLRPYQWVGGMLGIALGIRFVTGKVVWPLFRWHWVDTFLTILVGGIIASGLLNQGLAIKQTLVIISFFFLYCLSRVFLRTLQDVKVAFRFFLLSGSLVLFWGIGQNLLFLSGEEVFSVMPGRPNGTLGEPDWLGLFILFLLAPTLLWMKEQLTERFDFRKIWLPWGSLLLIFTVLILTVSRSAWLGALILTGVFVVTAFFESGKKFAFQGALLFIECSTVAFVLALILIEAFSLTRFALIDRAGSTVSHLQEITIACDGRATPPERIENTGELAQYGCRHILLEEKEAERSGGKLVMTTFRPDPNVNIRKMLYTTAWANIKAHPLLGIGWGNIGPQLGVDERGASYNASNLFLELWLGGGIIALFAFMGFLLLISWTTYLNWTKQALTPYFATLLALLAGFLVVNLFNTGLLLGFVWVFLALFPLSLPAHLKDYRYR